MRRLAPLAALLVAFAFVAGGCGSNTKAANDYVDAVNKAQNDFAATFDRLESQITSTSTPAQDQKTLGGFRKAVDKVVGDLRAIEVPDKVKDEHRRLVAEISSYGSEIDKAQRAFSTRDPQAIIKAQVAFRTAVTRISGQINRTIDAINKKLRS